MRIKIKITEKIITGDCLAKQAQQYRRLDEGVAPPSRKCRIHRQSEIDDLTNATHEITDSPQSTRHDCELAELEPARFRRSPDLNGVYDLRTNNVAYIFRLLYTCELDYTFKECTVFIDYQICTLTKIYQ